MGKLKRKQMNRRYREDLIKDFDLICERLHLSPKLEIEKLLAGFIEDNKEVLKKKTLSKSVSTHSGRKKGIGFLESPAHLKVVG